MIHLMVAGPPDYIEKMQRAFEPHQQSLRIVTVASEAKLATDFLETSPRGYHAALFGFSESVNQALLETCVRYSTTFKPFVVCEDMQWGFRRWMPLNAQPVLQNNEAELIIRYFESQPILTNTSEGEKRIDYIAERIDIVDRKTKTEALTVRQKVVSVFAPMGGVGKTTLTVAVSKSLVALTKLKVCILDLDTSRAYGNALKYLGFIGDEKQRIKNTIVSWRDFPWEQKLIWEVVEQHLLKASNRLYVLPAVRYLNEVSMLTNEVVERTIDVLRKHFDLVMLDLGNNTTDSAITAMELSDELFLITKLDITDIDDMDEFLRENMPDIHLQASQINLIINYHQEGQRFTPQQAASYLGMSYVASFPEDPNVRHMLANYGQVPYLGGHDTPFTRELEKVLARLYPLALFQEQQTRKGWRIRLADWVKRIAG